MSQNAFDLLKSRGFVEQATHEDEIREKLGGGAVTFYVGFDPTADSLHVGHFMTVMAMAHMQRAGHRPIALVGGGTGMIGDPTHRTDMRRVMTISEIEHNCNRFKEQLSKFLDFEDNGGTAIMANNADWLLGINYISFLRDIGPHFSVNRMLAADCYKSRLEKGLTFLEFNYMLLQSYDFLELYKRYGCTMQMGGNDQWSNIIGGVELIRRIEGGSAFGMTFTLLTTSSGKKMGKTESGAVWLDRDKTSPYEFFQFWRSIEDTSVRRCLSLLTFLPLDEIARLCEGDINAAKEALAYEITKGVHSKEDADAALASARSLFAGGDGANAPSVSVPADVAAEGVDIVSALVLAGLCKTKSEGRRVIAQGGLLIDGEKCETHERILSAEELKAGVLLRKGKKAFCRLVVG